MPHAKPVLLAATISLLCGPLSMQSANASPTAYNNTCSASEPGNCLNGVGPAVTGPDAARTTVTKVSRQTNREAAGDDNNSAMLGHSALEGMNAGDGFPGIGVWASFSYTNFEADLPINSTVQPVASYDADQKSVLVGVDKLFGDNLVLGLALGYENTDIDTAYNGGNNDTDGYTISPYAAYLINNVFSVDIAGGYSNLDYETDRIDNISGGTILGEFDSSRWFGAANLNATVVRGAWVIAGRAGVLHTDENQEGYTEVGPNTARTVGDRDIDLTQAVLFGEIAYSTDTYEPFVNVGYYRDLSQEDGASAGGLPGAVGATQPDDDDEFQVGAGVRFFGESVSGSLEWNTVQGRDSFDSQSFLMSIRADF